MLRRVPITRRLSALTACLVAVLASVATPAIPAAADDSGRVSLRPEVPAAFRMYNADEGAKAANGDFGVPVDVERSDAGPARNVRVTVDTSGLAGVARVSRGSGGNCTQDGPVFTCVYGDVQNGDGESNNPFTLNGVDGVEPGDSGTLTYTVVADNAAPVTGTTRMTVGGPSLHTPADEESVKAVAPGTSRKTTPRFANHSRFTAEKGVSLRISADDGLLLTSRPDNCYFDTSATSATSAWCEFSTKAAPHTAYRTSAPVRYTAVAGKLLGTLSYTWSSDPERPAELSVRGTEPPLTLTRAPDRGLTGGTGYVKATTTVQVDYQPVTATVRGRVGRTVTVQLGVRDNGPGRPLSAETLGRFEVIPPEGTTVTSIPYTFEDDGGDWACTRPKKRGGAFVCEIGYDGFSEVRHEGGTTVIGFRIRIDRQVPGAKGTIRTSNPFDRTPGNDQAVIPLAASPALLPQLAHDSRAIWTAGSAAGIAVLVTLAIVRRRRRDSATAAANS
ncbi:hypothetical protein [Streptomyces prunicolor]|uniref:hypothetical protein n=1 Tax=Streptomyces prunicolor TaxID=67348 RepID=UPI0034464ED9